MILDDTRQATQAFSSTVRLTHAVAKGGPHDYAVLDLQERRVVSRHRTEAAATRAMVRLTGDASVEAPEAPDISTSPSPGAPAADSPPAAGVDLRNTSSSGRTTTVYEPASDAPFPIPTRAVRDPAGFYLLKDAKGCVWATLSPVAVDPARFDASVEQLMQHVARGETERVVAEYRIRCRDKGQ